MNKVDLSINIKDLNLKNPVLTASGTYGFGLKYNKIIDVSKLGGIVTKGITLTPRKGNPGIRLWETTGGLINSIGLENPGVDAFLKDYLPQMRNLGTKIIVNISGNTLEEYVILSQKLNGVKNIDALEVNISCPNVKAGGMAFGTSAEMARNITKAVKETTSLPVIVKLSPNVTDIGEIAQAVEEGGADAVSLINTLLGMAVDIKTQKPVLGNVMGGLSGPCVKPVALRMVWQVAQSVNTPIIGGGGITSWQDAVEFILAGASAVSIGTANFVNPLAPLEIIEGIEKYCQIQGVESVKKLIGKAHK